MMSWTRILWTIAGLVPLIGLLAFGLTRSPNDIDSPLPGRDAPPFELQVFRQAPGQDPVPVAKLAEHPGEVVVLNFFASWCLACRGEHPILSGMAQRYQGQGVQFYGVLYNDSPENGLRWIDQMGGQSYPAVLDPGSRTAIDYGLYGVPETFIIGPDGRVAYKHTGPISAAVLTEWIEKLKNPAPATGGNES